MLTIKIARSVTAIATAVAALGPATTLAQSRPIEPVLEFPEAGLDDSAAYRGYRTRFFRDATGNVVQVYLDAASGRVVNVLADALNESVGFTVRDAAGKPLRVDWASPGASVSRSGAYRSIEYRLTADAPVVQIGWTLLGSMRVERDLQYSGRHLEPFGSATFRLPVLEEVVANVERLPARERSHHLRMLAARDLDELRARLQPAVTTLGGNTPRGVSVTQPSLDDKTHLRLELEVDPGETEMAVSSSTLTLRARNGNAVRFTVRVSTDAPSLTPLARDEIFNADFLRFVSRERAAADSAKAAGSARGPAGEATIAQFRRLERDIRSVELLSAQEKLMAGMPNYGTYFGRDMLMAALMMQPVWSAAMSEHVIASVLRKLGPAGDVSHEEALGGQAIRENAEEYNAHLARYFQLSRSGDRPAADSSLARAHELLGNLQRVRENYHMLDDEFQLPVLVARYLASDSVSARRKRDFLMDSSDGRGSRIALLFRELGLVATLAAPYAREPSVQNLVASPRLDSARWRPVSWRDSNVGYANGRFAMDINAIWVPRALESIATIFGALREIGVDSELTARLAASSGHAALARFARYPDSLESAVRVWEGAARHFEVSLPAADVSARIARKLESLSAEERAYWSAALALSRADSEPLEFLAISLDSAGRPIPVVNTDPATWLFLNDRAGARPNTRARVLRDVAAVMRAYPVGLLIDGLGPVVANDAYASPEVWAAFHRDRYHSPRVVWGREVNLLTLGLAQQISSVADRDGQLASAAVAAYVGTLRDALRHTTAAVEASGLKHNELWSYEIVGGRLVPIRYGASTDIQLWNVTDLAVQFVLSRLAPAPGN
ncbi:MAG: hypothetical protein WEA80_05535 [Gemmatimonadaceae bacterium]